MIRIGLLLIILLLMIVYVPVLPAQDSLGISYLGSAFDYWAQVGDVAFHDGNLVVNNGYGFRIFDISDPENPDVICKYNGVDNQRYGLSKMLVRDDVVITVGQHGVFTIDISDYNSPHLIDSYQFEYAADDLGYEIHNLALSDNEVVVYGLWWYLWQGWEGVAVEMMKVFEVTEDGELDNSRTYDNMPQGSWNGYAIDLEVHNRVVYALSPTFDLREPGMQIVMVDLDAEVPEWQEYSILTENISAVEQIEAVGDYLYCLEPENQIKVLAQYEDGATFVDSFETDAITQVHSLGDDFYLTGYDEQQGTYLQFYDAADPTVPEQIVEYTPTPFGYYNYNDGNWLVSVGARDSHITVHDISDWQDLHHYTTISPTVRTVRSVDIIDEMLVTYGSGYTEMQEMTNFAAIEYQPSGIVFGDRGLDIVDNYAYSLYYAGLARFDISDFTNPVDTTYYYTETYTNDFVIVDDRIYLTGTYWDVVDLETMGSEYGDGVNPDIHLDYVEYEDGYLYFSGGKSGEHQGQILIMDEEQASLAQEIEFVGSVETGLHYARNHKVSDGYVYAVSSILVDSVYIEDEYWSDWEYVYSSGFAIFDCRDVENPQLVADWHQGVDVHDLFVAGDKLFLATTDGLVVFSTVDKSNPQLIGYYNTPGYISSIVVDEEVAIAANGNSLSFFDLSQLSIKGDFQEQIPSRTGIMAYPNPFNSTTRVEYTLPVGSEVRITLYDVNGRLVGDLFRGVQTAGLHDLTVEANDLAAGMYLLKLNSDRRELTGKLLLIK